MQFKSLVSIIVPAYNAEKFIIFTLDSVISQTYDNWECIVVDDCSIDATIKVVEQYKSYDSRITLIRNSSNLGAAISRNTAVEAASGKYIAFLDSDDIWVDCKLEKQVQFMEENNCLFSNTSYGKIDETGKILDFVRHSQKKLDYWGLLKEGIGNSTVIYNAERLGKFYIPDIKKRNDYVMWLQVIKLSKEVCGLDEVLAYYRLRNGSLSNNKFSLLKYQWTVYRDIEKLSIVKSLYLMIYIIIKSILKER